ncbi:MAG: SWIM zinc finger family protein, partial [Thermoplasmata archaeon]|nr:SWIM zinc finger family protein [Thermoplasmata archaeon]
MKLDNAKIEKTFGETISDRGYDYYHGGHVVQVLKLGNTLTGTVGGNAPEPYTVEVDLSKLKSSCTCPYSHMCKHGAAVLYHLADNSEVIDGDIFIADLKKMPKKDIMKLIESLIVSNPFLIPEISFQKEGGTNVKYLVEEFGRRTGADRGFLAQQQELKRLERVITQNILSLPPGDEKAELIMEF